MCNALEWCRGRDSNPHALGAADFESAVSAISPPRLGAGEGNRTLVTSLEGWGSAIELHPRVGRNRLTESPYDTISLSHSQVGEFGTLAFEGLEA